MKYLFYMLLFFMISCIGDDIIEDRVPEIVRITNAIDSLQIGDEYLFNAEYFDNIGRKISANVTWSSSDDAVLNINSAGLATGISDGIAIVEAAVDGAEGRVLASHSIVVSMAETSEVGDIRTGTIRTTSSYVLTGDFELLREGANLRLALGDNFNTTDALPGLYVYLGNNPNSISSALEIGKVTQFSEAHDYEIVNADLFEYQHVLFWCKPFGVKVGQGDFVE